MNLLAFGAHPDDLEFGCGGILIKAVKQKAHLTMVITSEGEAGSAGTPAVRVKEAENAARITGAEELVWPDFGGDCHIEYNLTNRLVIARLIREYMPDMVLAPFLQENQHPDHVVLARLVRDAARLARYGGLKELAGLRPHEIKSLYYYISSPTQEIPHDLLVDVSAELDQWVKAIKAHVSQVANKGYLEMILARAQSFGSQAGVAYALPLWANEVPVVEEIRSIVNAARAF